MKISDYISDWNDKGARFTVIVMGIVLLLVGATFLIVAPGIGADLKKFIHDVVH